MGRDVFRLVGISAAPLDVTAVYEAVQSRSVGAVVVFVGVVRDYDGGKDVTALAYSAHPTAEAMLRDVVAEIVMAQSPDADGPGTGSTWPVEAVAAVHRVGDLTIGDAAVVVAVACGHRGQAFTVCERLIDEIKARVPIWKHQIFADGTDAWVGTPE